LVKGKYNEFRDLNRKWIKDGRKRSKEVFENKSTRELLDIVKNMKGSLGLKKL